jgi:hypothetical protein
MAGYTKRVRIARLSVVLMGVAAVLGGIGWGLYSTLGQAIIGLGVPWSCLLGAVVCAILFGVTIYLIFLGTVLVYPWVTGEQVNWR